MTNVMETAEAMPDLAYAYTPGFVRGGGAISSKFSLSTSQLVSRSLGLFEEEQEEEEDKEEEENEEAGAAPAAATTPPVALAAATPPAPTPIPTPPTATPPPATTTVSSYDIRPVAAWLAGLRQHMAGLSPVRNEHGIDADTLKQLVCGLGEADVALQNQYAVMHYLADQISSQWQPQNDNLSRTQRDGRLIALYTAVLQAHHQPDYSKYKHDDLDADIKRAHAQVRQLGELNEERRQALAELAQLETRAQTLATAQAARKTDLDAVQRELQASHDKLNFIKTTWHKQKQRMEHDMSEIGKLQVDNAEQRTKLAQLKRAKDDAALAMQRTVAEFEQAKLAQADAQAQALAQAQLAQESSRPSSCVFCRETKSNNSGLVLGQLMPCKHGMCEGCLQEGQEMGRLYEQPFFHMYCNECDSRIERILFDRFDFDPLLGMRVDK